MSAYTLALAAAALELDPSELLPLNNRTDEDPKFGSRAPKDLSDGHRHLLDRLLASAAHGGNTHATTKTKHR